MWVSILIIAERSRTGRDIVSCCMKCPVKTTVLSGPDQWTPRGGEACSRVDCVDLDLLGLKSCPGSLTHTPAAVLFSLGPGSTGADAPSLLYCSSRELCPHFQEALPFRAPPFIVMVALQQPGHLWLTEAGPCAGLGTLEDNFFPSLSVNIFLYCSFDLHCLEFDSFYPLFPKSTFTCKF